MIVDIVNTVLDGGPAIATRRLHDALRARGVDSRFWYTLPSATFRPDPSYGRLTWSTRRPDHWSDVPQWVRHRARWMSLRRTLNQSFAGKPENAASFHAGLGKNPTPFRRDLLTGDLLHLNWIARHLDLGSFFATMPTSLPVVWTLHDMQPLTGGCEYADDCRAFQEQCRYCPLLAEPGPDDLSSLGFSAKRAAYAQQALHLVTPSRWLEDQVRRSALLHDAASIRTIYPPIDTQLFQPTDKRAARQALGLDPDCFWIAFAAHDVAAPRKGLADLLRALREWPNRIRAHVLSFGHGSVQGLDNQVSLHHFGYQRDERRQQLLLAAADVFVLSSHADQLPSTAIEAMACGTPVVAYAVGGAAEVVRHEETGLLAERSDTTQLRQHLLWLADHSAERSRMGTAARELVVREFDQRRQAARYANLYEEVRAAHAWTGDTHRRAA